jgi:hypothetical protein
MSPTPPPSPLGQDAPNVSAPRALAEHVREAVLRAVAEGFQHASMSGLCEEGALEVAIGRARSLDLGSVIADADADPPQIDASE